jgi:hypothetical protein
MTRPKHKVQAPSKELKLLADRAKPNKPPEQEPLIIDPALLGHDKAICLDQEFEYPDLDKPDERPSQLALASPVNNFDNTDDDDDNNNNNNDDNWSRPSNTNPLETRYIRALSGPSQEVLQSTEIDTQILGNMQAMT